MMCRDFSHRRRVHQTQWTISQRPLKTDLFIPNHTDWGWGLIGLTGHPERQNQAAWSENSSPQYRWSLQTQKSVCFARNRSKFTWKRKSLQHVSPCHHFFWGIPKIIPMWWACRMSYSICSRACRGSLRWFCGWLPSLKCLAVCSPCPCPCPQIPNHGSWNIMKWWISVDIQKKHVWYQIPLYMKSIEIT
jgi:hypothetical protein